MLVAIHKAWHDKKDPELEVYREILKYNNIDYIDVDSSDVDFWDKIKNVDLFLYKWGHIDNQRQTALTILPVIENAMGINCYPTMATSWHYDDKVRQYLLLKEHNIPIIQSWIFWDKNKAIEWSKKTKYPVVFKLAKGSGSLNVKLIHSQTEAESIIKRMFGKGVYQEKMGFINNLKIRNFNPEKIARYYGIKMRNFFQGKDTTNFWQVSKNYVLFQKFLPGNEYDTRVQITGRRAYAFRRFNRPNDFRASGSNNWDLDRSKIDMKMVQIALDTSKKLNFQSMAYDFIYDENKDPQIVEISYCYGDYPEFSTGYWDEDLKWHDGRYVPQYLELMDALKMSELKQPPDIQVDSPYQKATIKSEQ